jgi:indolepyruvate decarboxylase
VAFTVADYIVRRLAQQQVDTLFGVPAAYCSPLFDVAIRQGMRTVVTASDLGAGYAADGYARTKGLGAASVAYGVGALSMINAIAAAFVERSPMVVVDGGPTPGALSNLHQFDVVPSHSIGQDATDLSGDKLVTASAARAGTVAKVPPLVNAAIASAIRTKRPHYIDVNMGIWDSACPMTAGALPVAPRPAGTESALAAAIVVLIRAARSPEILCRRQGVQRAGADPRAGGRARPAGRADGGGLGRRQPAAMKSGMVGNVMR